MRRESLIGSWVPIPVQRPSTAAAVGLDSLLRLTLNTDGAFDNGRSPGGSASRSR